jgi:hypothetical protein
MHATKVLTASALSKESGQLQVPAALPPTQIK